MQENNKVENMKNEQIAISNKTKPKVLRGLIIALEIILLIITFIVIVLIYLHNSRFKVAFNQMELNNYFKTQDIHKILEIEDNTVAIELSNDVITTSFNERIKHINLANGYKILDGYIDTNKSKAFINLNIYGINIPIAMDIVLEVEKREVTLKLQNMTLRNKKLLSLPNILEKSIKNKLINNETILTINLDDYNIPPMASLSKVSFAEDKLIVMIAIDKQKLNELMKKLNTAKSQELYEIYKNDKDNIDRQKAAKYMDNPNDLTNIEVKEILTDILISDEKLTKDILTIANEEDVNSVLEKYDKYITHFDKKTVINDKNKLILGKIEKCCAQLLEYVEQLPKEEYIVFLNNPYSLEQNIKMTIQDLVNKYKLDVTEEIYNKMEFLYNYNNKNYIISYKIDDNKYAIVDKDSYSFIDNNAFIEYGFNEPLEANLILDNEIKTKIDEYFSSNAFIRYMKSDGKYAYVVASDEKNYQDYEKFALEKNDTWKIIDTNINDLYTFSINHPGFNISTLTDDFLNDTLYELSEDDKFAILDQLQYRDIIEDKKDIGLAYCSYDGKYIAFKLTNSEEYVFLIKYSYLDKLYKKDEAIKQWKDISPLILLQDDVE
jgi:hypothetical protein